MCSFRIVSRIRVCLIIQHPFDTERSTWFYSNVFKLSVLHSPAELASTLVWLEGRDVESDSAQDRRGLRVEDPIP